MEFETHYNCGQTELYILSLTLAYVSHILGINNCCIYIFPKALEARMLILTALTDIEKHTCVRFKQKKNKNFINVINKFPRCLSWVGLKGDGAQPLNLGRNCLRSKGLIIHEFLHALGFFHQHNSPDRDDFIIVKKSNVKHGAEPQFEKYSHTKITSFGYKYDYDSIMHYGSKQFGKKGKTVIIPRCSGAENMGQRKGLSKTDIAKINKMYNCKKSKKKRRRKFTSTTSEIEDQF